MSADSNGPAIELMEKGEDETILDIRQPTEKKKAKEPFFEDRFKTILTADYKNKKAWWNDVEGLLKKDDDFREKVSGLYLFYINIIL